MKRLAMSPEELRAFLPSFSVALEGAAKRIPGASIRDYDPEGRNVSARSAFSRKKHN